MELKGPLAKPPVIDRIGAVPIPPPNPFREEELDYSGTDIPYKYRGLGDVEFRADIQKYVNTSPLAISALADIEKRTGGDYGKLINFTRPGVFKNLKGEDVQVGGTYKSEEGQEKLLAKGLHRPFGWYTLPWFRRKVAKLEGKDVEDIPAITINPDKADTFGPGTYDANADELTKLGYRWLDHNGKPRLHKITDINEDMLLQETLRKKSMDLQPKQPWWDTLRHELDHYGIQSLINVNKPDTYFYDPSNTHPLVPTLDNDSLVSDYMADDSFSEHDIIIPLDVLQGESVGIDLTNTVPKLATEQNAKDAELLRYERQFGHTPYNESPAIHYRNRLDELALKRLEELGIPKTPTNIQKVSWLNKLGQWFGLSGPQQPRYKYGL